MRLFLMTIALCGAIWGAESPYCFDGVESHDENRARACEDNQEPKYEIVSREASGDQRVPIAAYLPKLESAESVPEQGKCAHAGDHMTARDITLRELAGSRKDPNTSHLPILGSVRGMSLGDDDEKHVASQDQRRWGRDAQCSTAIPVRALVPNDAGITLASEEEEGLRASARRLAVVQEQNAPVQPSLSESLPGALDAMLQILDSVGDGLAPYQVAKVQLNAELDRIAALMDAGQDMPQVGQPDRVTLSDYCTWVQKSVARPLQQKIDVVFGQPEVGIRGAMWPLRDEIVAMRNSLTLAAPRARENIFGSEDESFPGVVKGRPLELGSKEGLWRWCSILVHVQDMRPEALEGYRKKAEAWWRSHATQNHISGVDMWSGIQLLRNASIPAAPRAKGAGDYAKDAMYWIGVRIFPYIRSLGSRAEPLVGALGQGMMDRAKYGRHTIERRAGASMTLSTLDALPVDDARVLAMRHVQQQEGVNQLWPLKYDDLAREYLELFASVRDERLRRWCFNRGSETLREFYTSYLDAFAEGRVANYAAADNVSLYARNRVSVQVDNACRAGESTARGLRDTLGSAVRNSLLPSWISSRVSKMIGGVDIEERAQQARSAAESIVNAVSTAPVNALSGTEEQLSSQGLFVTPPDIFESRIEACEEEDWQRWQARNASANNVSREKRAALRLGDAHHYATELALRRTQLENNQQDFGRMLWRIDTIKHMQAALGSESPVNFTEEWRERWRKRLTRSQLEAGLTEPLPAASSVEREITDQLTWSNAINRNIGASGRLLRMQKIFDAQTRAHASYVQWLSARKRELSTERARWGLLAPVYGLVVDVKDAACGLLGYDTRCTYRGVVRRLEDERDVLCQLYEWKPKFEQLFGTIASRESGATGQVTHRDRVAAVDVSAHTGPY